MTPNAAAAGTAPRASRRAAFTMLALAGLACAMPAQAGDRALIDYIGYSADGRYFAFEEFGIQDGSGFPFSTLYIIDLPADSWVEGSPYRVLLESDDADVDEAREAALEQAEARLDELEIGAGADVVALNGDGETTDGQSLSFGTPGYGLQEPNGVHELTIETFSAPSPEDCVGYIGEEALGYALAMDGVEIHRDTGDLPRSRGCPLGYRIHAVVMPPEWLWEVQAPLAVIASYPFGFEGPDRRFLVVPLPH